MIIWRLAVLRHGGKTDASLAVTERREGRTSCIQVRDIRRSPRGLRQQEMPG